VAREGVDDLLQPVLADRDGEREPEQRPWRLTSQVYVAVLGGALAVAAVGALNARRLRIGTLAQAIIVGAGLVAEAVLVAVARAADLHSQARIASAVAGVAVYGVAFLVQRSADRVYAYHAREDDPYAGLLAVGVVAVLCARLIELVLIFPRP
jgi:hypothetical protein